MLRRLAFSALFLIFLIAPASAQTESRIALLLGYDVGTGSQQSNDVEEFGKVLAQLGFRVRTVTNASPDESGREIAAFGLALKSNGGVGLVFVAGSFTSNDAGASVATRKVVEGPDGARRVPAFVPFESIYRAFGAAPLAEGVLIVDHAADPDLVPIADKRQPDNGSTIFRAAAVPRNVSAYASIDRNKVAQCRRHGLVAAAILRRLGTGVNVDVGGLFRAVDNEIRSKSNDVRNSIVVKGPADDVALIDDERKPEEPLEGIVLLFEDFTLAGKCRCGFRDEQRELGLRIINDYYTDTSNIDVVEFARQKVAEIEADDPLCRLRRRFEESYATENWPVFFETGDALVESERDRAAVLDVRVQLVQSGYERIVKDKNCLRSLVLPSDASAVFDLIDLAQRPRTNAWGYFQKITTEAETIATMHLARGTAAELCSRSIIAAVPDYEAFVRFRGADETKVRIHDRLARFYNREASTVDFPDAADRALFHSIKAFQLARRTPDVAKIDHAKLLLKEIWSKRQVSAGKSAAVAEWNKYLESVEKMPPP